jgi:hypothetical protein
MQKMPEVLFKGANHQLLSLNEVIAYGDFGTDGQDQNNCQPTENDFRSSLQ